MSSKINGDATTAKGQEESGTTTVDVVGTGAKRARHPANAADLQRFMNEIDIWVNYILPFVGPGHFIFVASVCRILRDYYKKHFLAISKPPSAPSSVRSTGMALTKRPATCSDTFYSAVFSSVSCAKFWYDATKGMENQFTKACLVAAKAGSLPVLQWARDNNFPWDGLTCAAAAMNGHLDVLKYARKNGCPWDLRTCFVAARKGYLDVLKWAHENGCPWDYLTCSNAAWTGHLEILKWARENGCPWDKETCSHAAMGGHLEVLKWARENGCPWDSSTCTCAAQEGHLEILKWARKNGCPWDLRVRETQHPEVLAWALENGCP